MQEQKLEYFDGDSKLIGTLIQSEGAGTAAIILFPAFEGPSDFALDYGRDLAELGYQVLVADMYGDGQVATTIPGCFELIGPFLEDRALVRRRAELAYQALKDATDASTVATIGFCFGGMCGLELARSGADVAATISLHGVLQKSDLPTNTITGRVFILHGYQDPQIPPECLTEFAEEMKAIDRNDWVFTFFGDGKHSFTDPATGSFDAKQEQEMGREYNEQVAKTSFNLAVNYLAETL